MALELTPEQKQSFAEAVYAGNKITAIKQLREVSGLDLKDSKEIIDRLESELRVAHPERFARSRKSGCFVLLILMFPVAVVVWFLLRG